MATETGTQAIDRAAQLLVRVVESADPPSVGELSSAPVCRRARPPVSSPRSRGRASFSDSANAAAFARARSFLGTQAATRRQTLVELARADLRRLADASGETINLAVPGPTASSTSRRRTPRTSSASPTGSAAASRSSSPPTASASSPSAERDGSTTPTRTRSAPRGYATSIDELEVGLSAIAAPVLGADGVAVAALSISGPTTRLTRAHRRARAATRKPTAAALLAHPTLRGAA